MTYFIQHYKSALVRNSGWARKLLGISFFFFLAKGMLWLMLFSVVIFKGLF